MVVEAEMSKIACVVVEEKDVNNGSVNNPENSDEITASTEEQKMLVSDMYEVEKELINSVEVETRLLSAQEQTRSC